MVSHAAVEQAIASALPCEGMQDCVIGAPCPDKGEQLILLTTLRRVRRLCGALSQTMPCRTYGFRGPLYRCRSCQPSLPASSISSCLKLAEGAVTV